ncbi:MAG: nickel-dependent lactate racemase [Candidatus Asgardarchaeia archaeon]
MSMLARIPYGKGKVEVEFPEDTMVLEAKFPEPREEGDKVVEESIKRPICSSALETIREGKKVLVITTDATRATPNKVILPIILSEIFERGVREDDVKLLVANGLHSPMDDKQIEEFFGKEVLEKVDVLNHDAYDEGSLVKLGKTSFGTPVILNKEVIDSDVVIGLGMIEPHFFAGYSGGRKIILPGVSGAESIMKNHSFKMISHPKARYGILDGNPIHEDMLEFLSFAKLDFITNVVLDKERRIVGAFSGDPIKAHLSGVSFLEKFVKVRGKEVDVVVTSNGGYPLDRNLYQAVKGMATGEMVVREGGVIIILADCVDGIGHEEFYEIMCQGEKPEDVLEYIRKNEPIPDQWQAQILARVLKKADVVVVTKGVKEDRIEEMKMRYSSSFEEALEYASKKIGRDARFAVIPDGPYVIPSKNFP